MDSVLAGVFCFFLIGAADWATYKKIRPLKIILWFAVLPVGVFAFTTSLMDNGHFDFPFYFTGIAWVTLVVFFASFVYSLFIEIPLKTYTNRAQPEKVVKTGTYALCRHPAFLWFNGLLVSLIVVSESVNLAIATPFWVAAYLACVLFEDWVYSKSEFGGEYLKYKKQTPFLIPTRKSICDFWKSMRFPGLSGRDVKEGKK